MNHSLIVLPLFLASNSMAQRVFEKGAEVVYEDANKNQTNLGRGFSPVLMSQGKVALIRGRLFGYGEYFDCSKRATKNWVSVYDSVTGTEKTLFDRALPFQRDGLMFCIFDQMQMSPDGAVLYLVSPVYATSGSLAIIHLAHTTVTYVPGVDRIYVIESGPHRGELIYQRRIDEPHGVHYPFVHARANGQQIRVLAEEVLADENPQAPVLGAYLNKIGARISVNGRPFPR